MDEKKPAPAPPAKPEPPSMILIRSWPKMIFLWPMALIGLCMGMANQYDPGHQNLWGGVFMIALGLNLVVLTFEFPRGTSLTMFFAIAAALLLVFFINQYFSIVGPLERWFSSRQIHASSQFYYMFTLVLGVLFFAMYCITRFDYWELSANELVHHHGLLGDVERFSTHGLRLSKEISDVFEYMIAGAGRLILQIPGTPRPIVLDNVLSINRIERQADELLEANVVRIEHAPGSAPPANG